MIRLTWESEAGGPLGDCVLVVSGSCIFCCEGGYMVTLVVFFFLGGGLSSSSESSSMESGHFWMVGFKLHQAFLL